VIEQRRDGAHLFFKFMYAKHVWQQMMMEREWAQLAEKLSAWETTS
jgi:hypothetical protein